MLRLEMRGQWAVSGSLLQKRQAVNMAGITVEKIKSPSDICIWTVCGEGRGISCQVMVSACQVLDGRAVIFLGKSVCLASMWRAVM